MFKRSTLFLTLVLTGCSTTHTLTHLKAYSVNPCLDTDWASTKYCSEKPDPPTSTPIPTPEATAPPQASPIPPGPSAAPSNLTTQITEMHLVTQTRFFNGKGEQTQITLLDQNNNPIPFDQLILSSERNQDIAIDAQGTITALKAEGYSHLVFQLKNSDLSLRELFSVSTANTGGTFQHGSRNRNATPNPTPTASPLSPVITNFSPRKAEVGRTLTIQGENLNNLTGAKFLFQSVDSTGTPFSIEQTVFTILSDSEVEIVVPAGAQTGTLSVVHEGQTQNLNGLILQRIYVNSAASGDGHSFDNGLATFADAVNLAEANDEIWIIEGNYSVLDPVSIALDGIKVYGGFQSANPEFNISDRDVKTHVTVLQGDGTKNLLTLDANDLLVHGLSLEQSTRAIHISSNSQHTQLTDLVIQNNGGISGSGVFHQGDQTQILRVEFKDNTATTNGAAFAHNGSGQASFENVRFERNSATGTGSQGGAVYNAGGNLSFLNCSFHKNDVRNLVFGIGAGAFANASGQVEIIASTFTENLSGKNSGAFANVGSATLNRVIFANNTGGVRGGAIYTNGGTMNVSNTAFVNNIAQGGSGGGGAVYINGGVNGFTHTTFANNQASNGGNIYRGSGTVSLINTVFWKGSLRSVSGVSTTVNSDGTIMLADGGQPFLSDFSNGTLAEVSGIDGLFFTSDDGYLLNPTDANFATLTTEGIDASANPLVAQDVLNNPRPQGSGPDIGAFEVQP